VNEPTTTDSSPAGSGTRHARWLLYGANGYTGELIAREAHQRGLRPVLAGRRREAIEPLARELGLESRIFALESPDAIAREIDDVDAVLLAAGPFIHTSSPMVAACLRARKHYLDITGEIAVFEACHRRDAKAREAGCVLLPGVGFDVVPSDCLAACLAAALPDAQQLELAFCSSGGLSQGTLKTMLEGFHLGGAIRAGGKIRRVPFAWKRARIPFRDRVRHAISIPWGDVSTAFHSTGIPNIIVYTTAPRRAWRWRHVIRIGAPLLCVGALRRHFVRRIERAARGPDAETRASAEAQLWGRATNAAGRTVEGTLRTPEAYRLTALTAVASVERLLGGGPSTGFLTPSRAFGSRFIVTIVACDLELTDASR